MEAQLSSRGGIVAPPVSVLHSCSAKLPASRNIGCLLEDGAQEARRRMLQTVVSECLSDPTRAPRLFSSLQKLLCAKAASIGAKAGEKLPRLSTFGSTDASWLMTVCATFLEAPLPSLAKLVEADADVVKKLMTLEVQIPWTWSWASGSR